MTALQNKLCSKAQEQILEVLTLRALSFHSIQQSSLPPAEHLMLSIQTNRLFNIHFPTILWDKRVVIFGLSTSHSLPVIPMHQPKWFHYTDSSLVYVLCFCRMLSVLEIPVPNQMIPWKSGGSIDWGFKRWGEIFVHRKWTEGAIAFESSINNSGIARGFWDDKTSIIYRLLHQIWGRMNEYK